MEVIDWGAGMPLMAGPFTMGLSEPSPETVDYWRGVKNDKLLIKRCTACGQHHHPRRLICTACNRTVFDWIETSGRAKVYTFSTVHRAPRPEFDAEVPYTVGIMELEEGVYLFSRIVDAQGGNEVRIGADAELFFQETGPSGRLPAYRIAA